MEELNLTLSYDVTDDITKTPKEEVPEVFNQWELDGLANSFAYKPTDEEIKSVMSWATRVQLEHNILTALIDGKANIIGFKDGHPLLDEHTEKEIDMEEQTTENFNDFYSNKLKSVTVQDLEEAIKKAVFDLVGIEFKCNISQIEFSKTNPQGAKFDVDLHESFNDTFTRLTGDRFEQS